MSIVKKIKKVFSIFFTLIVKKQVRSYISPLKVNGFSIVSKNTILGKNINFNGKNIVLASEFLFNNDTSYISSTIIDGNQNGSVVTFNNGENGFEK